MRVYSLYARGNAAQSIFSRRLAVGFLMLPLPLVYGGPPLREDDIATCLYGATVANFRVATHNDNDN